MVETRAGAWRHRLVVGLVFSTMVLAGLGLSPAEATHRVVTDVQGSAYGCFGDTTFGFGEPGPPVVTGPLPEVELPAGGSAVPITATEPTCDILVDPAPGSPPIITTGPLTVATQGTTGPTGSVTSTADIADVNRTGQEALTAANVSSTCTANEDGNTGSTTVTGGNILTDPDDEVGEPIPVNPEPGYTVFADLGVATSNYIFNEQIMNADGSITVNAVRIEPLTGPVEGTVIIGQVVCGVTTVAAPTTTTEAPITTTTTEAPITSTTGGANQAPVAVDDAYTTPQNQPLVVAAPGVLTNDSDPDGDPLTAGMPTDPSSGTLNLSTNGGFTYTPNTGFSGTDTFTYMAHDPFGGMTTATVRITVTPVVPPTSTTSTPATTTTSTPATTTTSMATTTTSTPATTTTSTPATTTTSTPATTTTAPPATTTTAPPATTTTSMATTTTAPPATTTTAPPATTTTAPPATTTTSTPAPGGPIQIDEEALSDGRVARLTGTITCDEGDRYRIRVMVTQGEADGEGIATGNCTGESQSFRVIVRARSGDTFEEGTAQVRAMAQIGDPDTQRIVDRFSTNEEVEIEIPEGMGAAMLKALGAAENQG